VTRFLQDKVKKKGYQVTWEPHFFAANVRLKPDLLIRKEGSVWIVDTAIVGDNIDPDVAFRDKVAKYSSSDFLRVVAEKLDVERVNISIGALIFNFRGALAPQSAIFLKDFLSLDDFKVLSVRVLQYGIYIFDSWAKSTAMSFAQVEEN
jgi:hypothetical protein